MGLSPVAHLGQSAEDVSIQAMLNSGHYDVRSWDFRETAFNANDLLTGSLARDGQLGFLDHGGNKLPLISNKIVTQFNGNLPRGFELGNVPNICARGRGLWGQDMGGERCLQ